MPPVPAGWPIFATVSGRCMAPYGVHRGRPRNPRGTPRIGVVVLSQTQMRAMPGRSSMTAPAGLAYLLKDRVGYLEDLVR